MRLTSAHNAPDKRRGCAHAPRSKGREQQGARGDLRLRRCSCLRLVDVNEAAQGTRPPARESERLEEARALMPPSASRLVDVDEAAWASLLGSPPSQSRAAAQLARRELHCVGKAPRRARRELHCLGEAPRRARRELHCLGKAPRRARRELLCVGRGLGSPPSPSGRRMEIEPRSFQMRNKPFVLSQRYAVWGGGQDCSWSDTENVASSALETKGARGD
jgi:hypothetical protein